MLQIKKLKELNKNLKSENTRLQAENFTLTDQFAKMKDLMIRYEHD